MSALAISTVKNEADIIEASIRHNLAYVDLMVVIDNASTDGTRDILRALQREGLPVLVIDDPVFGHFQSEKITRAYRMVAPVFAPDLVYLLDADEFVCAPDRRTLEHRLLALPPGACGLLPWTTYVPLPGTAADRLLADPLGEVTHRRRREEPVYYKAVVRRDPADDERLVVEQGNHAVRRSDDRLVPHHRIDGMAVAHLPVRSVAQLSAKVIVGWQACEVRNRQPDGSGEAYQWKSLYEQIVGGEELSDATLTEAGLDYAQSPRAGRSARVDLVHDPVAARYGVLRYLGLGRHGALAKVALALTSMGTRAPAALPGIAPRQAMDLAPALDLCDALQARQALVISADAGWAGAFAALRPSVVQPTPRAARDGFAVDLCFAPALDNALVPELIASIEPGTARRIAYWPTQARTAGQLASELEAWAQRGWEPDMFDTLGFRALCSYAASRQAAVVMGPADRSRPERAAAVRAALEAMDQRPVPWTDPAPMCVTHPLQVLGLGQPASPTATPTTASRTVADTAADPAADIAHRSADSTARDTARREPSAACA